MTIKQIIEEFNEKLKNKEIASNEELIKILGVLAVKAETIGGEEGKELAELCDNLRPYFKKIENGTLVDKKDILDMASCLAKLMHFSEKEEYYYLFKGDLS